MKANWKILLFICILVVVAALFATYFIGKSQEKDDSQSEALNSEGSVAGSTTIKGDDYTER
jgi:hypothetical protein